MQPPLDKITSARKCDPLLQVAPTTLYRPKKRSSAAWFLWNSKMMLTADLTHSALQVYGNY